MGKLGIGGLLTFVAASVAFVGVGFAGGIDARQDDAWVPGVEDAAEGDTELGDDADSAADDVSAEAAPSRHAAMPRSTPHAQPSLPALQSAAGERQSGLALPRGELPALPDRRLRDGNGVVQPELSTAALDAREYAEGMLRLLSTSVERLETAGSMQVAEIMLQTMQTDLSARAVRWQQLQGKLTDVERASIEAWGKPRAAELAKRLTAALGKLRAGPIGVSAANTDEGDLEEGDLEVADIDDRNIAHRDIVID